ncbi:desampylase [Natronorubrum halophilum]|uniref:desampylase n=1 Tax=Natronorubrum halophilum TaxID=1702106 RepID=UPI000EF725CA|nr:desampylase [Natronorubrum halophilum]
MTDGSDPESGPALVVPAEIRDRILERARDSRPAEICGVFGGEYDPAPDGRSRVRSHYPAENVAETPRTRYRIDPEAQLEIFEALEGGAGEEIVGFYHSHPRGPPRPSATDAAQATWPDRSYLIVSLEPLEVGSWRWRKEGESGAFERERLVLG